jgi:hypothetical protein
MSFVSPQNRLPARFYSRLLVAVNVNFSLLFRKSDSARSTVCVARRRSVLPPASAPDTVQTGL